MMCGNQCRIHRWCLDNRITLKAQWLIMLNCAAPVCHHYSDTQQLGCSFKCKVKEAAHVKNK